MGAVRPIALWATPRSGSTAFERMVIERGDHTVLTEPFSRAYYFGPDRVSERFPDESLPDSSYADVFRSIEAADGPVFFKDMPHHLGPHLTAATLARWTNTFLVRDPAWSLPSMARFWPDLTDDEAGFEAQHAAFDLCRELTGETPFVIDSDDLRDDADLVVAAWCAAVGIAHRRDALTWEPGLPPQWELWREWFEGTAATTGFVAKVEGPPPPADAALQERIDRARPHYEALRAERVVPERG